MEYLPGIKIEVAMPGRFYARHELSRCERGNPRGGWHLGLDPVASWGGALPGADSSAWQKRVSGAQHRRRTYVATRLPIRASDIIAEIRHKLVFRVC
jgi:hypothetical protein